MGGYVATNGISLCNGCHVCAEARLNGGQVADIFEPANLYKRINFSRELAEKESYALSKLRVS